MHTNLTLWIRSDTSGTNCATLLNVSSENSRLELPKVINHDVVTVLHDNQLTHTDLKPENILFENSDYETIYLTKKSKDRVSVGMGLT